MQAFPEAPMTFGRLREDLHLGCFRLRAGDTAAYAAMAQQADDFWSKATKRIDPQEQPVSFAITRPGRFSSASEPQTNIFDPFGMAKPWIAFEPRSDGQYEGVVGALSVRGQPCFLADGVPHDEVGRARDVALPAAEANVAVMDAARIAQRQLPEFSRLINRMVATPRRISRLGHDVRGAAKAQPQPFNRQPDVAWLAALRNRPEIPGSVPPSRLRRGHRGSIPEFETCGYTMMPPNLGCAGC